jgi:hypothetical protein
MKILLLGEYSRLHNSLKEGLQKMGHQVVLIGFNDGFKNFPVDYRLYKKWDNGFLKKLKVAVYKITGFEISSYLTYLQFKNKQSLFSGYDVVQLINENTFYCNAYFEKKILDFIFKNNKKVFLLSCGTDYLNVKYCFENPEMKSIVQPYLMGKITSKNFLKVLKFKSDAYRNTHEFIYQNCKGVIASDMDYHIPLAKNSAYLGLIPNPINLEKFEFSKLLIQDKIIIFHGINQENYYCKGNDYFENALAIIQKKYANQIEIITTRSVPYATYIDSYNKAHILLDQVFAYDQGYNALEAMAKGKVVFTGAEKEFMAYYQLTERVAVNAVPNVDEIVAALSFLIENPNEIIAIGERARKFIEKEHDSVKVAAKYVAVWE